MVIVGDVLVTKIIEKVIDVGFNYLADQHARHTGMKAERRRLETALPRIQAVVRAADNPVQAAVFVDNPHLKAWLHQFKDALYEADDALDELEYLGLQEQVEADDARDEDHNKVRPHLPSNSKQSSISKFGKRCKRFFKPDPTLENLRRAVKKLDEVAADVGVFEALVSSGVQQFHLHQHQSPTMTSRKTGSLVTESKVFGRDRERDELLQWLMEGQPDDQDVSLYSVVGLGGMGKTTLAQLVFNDQNVQKSFDLKMWVCVSTSFDATRITAAMLESATKKRTKIVNFDTLQLALKDKLMSSNKFLLVLDDVWDDQKNGSDWGSLLAPLRCERKGSKILLTTRMDKVAKEAAQAVGGSTKESLKLNPIHGHDFFSLFNRYAFASISSGDHKELQPLGKKIAERLGGSPLAAKTIGSLLNFNLDESYWTDILNCDNISDQGEGNILSILMLSYHHLPHHLRPCFAFCSTFPQDNVFEKEDLVLKWMALGLIKHSPRQAPEDIGSYYFDELFNRSFFEQKYAGSSNYIMHDLLHDVARSVSHGECFTIVNDDKSVEDIPNNVRHLYLDINNLEIVMKVDKWQQLRSLQLRIKSHVLPELPEVLEKVFKSLKCVRMLEVFVKYRDGMRILSDVMVRPDVFGHLRHMRNLRIRKEIDKFPASLCKLHNLQVLDLTIKDSTALPENMKNLISLRHLVTSSMHGGRICPVIARVRKLASLQVLSISIKKERGYKIDELEDLNMIRKLHLKGLENVESPEEASMAKLGKKEHLRLLTLEWISDNDTERNNPKMNEQQQILDCLQPHSSLKELTITGYSGVSPAKWMDFELVKNLQDISLSDCSRLEHLPSFRKLPFLKYLSLSKIFLVKQLDCDFQQLEVLYLNSMEGLEELSQPDENSGQWCPCLLHLTIVNSPKLSVLHSLSLGLESMVLENVGLTALPKLWLGSKGSSSSSSSSSLNLLLIRGCRKLTSLDKGLLRQQHHLTALEGMNICDCDMLVDFPAGGLQHLRALRRLTIRNCPNLRLDPTMIDPAGNDENFLPSSLLYLSIEGCAELGMLMPTLLKGDLTSLLDLYLHGMKFPPSLDTVWRKLASLDSLTIDDAMLLLTESFRNLTSLRELVIYDCSKLESISGQMEEWLLQSRTTLNILRLFYASFLKSLPDSLQTFSSLESLTLSRAGQLQSVPRLPSSVKHLVINDCNETLKDRCRKDEGADWPNIKHILNIRMGSSVDIRR